MGSLKMDLIVVLTLTIARATSEFSSGNFFEDFTAVN